MKMSKNYKKLCLALGLTSLIGTSALTAKSGTEKIAVTYRNIGVTYNGVQKSLTNEPFLVNGSTYVPLRAIGDILGVNAIWDKENNTVVLTGGSTTNATTEAELAQLRTSNAALIQQLNAVNTELAQLKANNTFNNNTSSNNTSNNGYTTTSGTNITAAQLQETENYLNDTYTNELSNKISMSYDLTLSGGQIYVTMEYSSKSEDRTYDGLSQTSIQTFIKKIANNVAATHADIAIEGTIHYGNSDDAKASFTRSKSGSFDIMHSFTEDQLIDEIKDETNDYFSIDASSLDSSLNISDVEVDIRSSKINVKLYVEDRPGFAEKWSTTSNKIGTADFTPLSDRNRENAVSNQLEDIQDLVADKAVDYAVTVTVYYGTSKETFAKIDADGDIITYTLNFTATPAS